MGQHLGADDFDAAVASGWRSMGYAMAAMTGLGAVVALFAEPLARFFLGDEPLTVHYTVQMTWIMAAMMPLLAVEFGIGGSLRGAGDTRTPLIATFVGLIGVRCTFAAPVHVSGVAGILGLCDADWRVLREERHAPPAVPVRTLEDHGATGTGIGSGRVALGG